MLQSRQVKLSGGHWRRQHEEESWEHKHNKMRAGNNDDGSRHTLACVKEHIQLQMGEGFVLAKEEQKINITH